MSDWPEWSVRELEKKGLLLVQDGNHGEYRPRKDEFTDEGVSFIRAADLGVGSVQFEKAEKINEVAFARITKGIGKDLDTVLSTKGTVGKLAYVPEGSPRFVCSPQTTFWRSLDQNFIVPLFLYYELQSRHFINQISSRKGETDMADYLSLTAQRGLVIRVPDKKVQLNVVEVLSCIDNKIELNRQTNQTLEQIAQAIFKSWFVDFEPVKAKIAAKQAWDEMSAQERTQWTQTYPTVMDDAPEATDGSDERAGAIYIERAAMRAISGKTETELNQLDQRTQQQLKTTAALFPDALVESELGEIPEGWGVDTTKNMGDVTDYVANGSFAALKENVTYLDEGYAILVRLTDYKSGWSGDFKYVDENSYNFLSKSSLKAGDIVISNVGAYAGTVFRVPDLGKPMTLGPNAVVIKTGLNRLYLYYYLISHIGQHQLDGIKGGSAQPKFNKTDFRSIAVIKPSELLLVKFNKVIKGIENLCFSNDKATQELTELRDLILPKLLSDEFTMEVQV